MPGGDDLRLLQHPQLETLGPLLRGRVVQQVLRELAQQAVQRQPRVVLRVAPDVGDPADRLEVQPGGDQLVEPVGRPPGRPLADDVGERLLVVHQPAVRLLEREVDQSVVGVVGDDLLQQPAGHGRDRLGHEPGDQHLLHQRGDVLRRAACAARSRATLAPSATTRSGVGRLAHPDARPGGRCRPPRAARGSPARAGSSRRRTPRGSCRTRPSCRGTSAVCGIGSPSGCRNRAVTANQSAMAPTMLASAPAFTNPRNPSWSRVSEVDHGSEEQQAQCHTLHPAQSRASYGVGLRCRGSSRVWTWLPETYPTPARSQDRHICCASAPPSPRRAGCCTELPPGPRARRRTHRRRGRGRTRPSARGVRTARVQPVRGPGRAAPGCPPDASGCGCREPAPGVGRPHHGAARPAPGAAGADRRRPPYGRPAALALHPGSAGPEGLGRGGAVAQLHGALLPALRRLDHQRLGERRRSTPWSTSGARRCR